ncbi:MAG: CPBP family intramembrane metalloprotease [Phycisphaerales bacterium]|nr:CPBP family intramembrane metalloprotease [Phycisphaerales bacterium]
MPGGGVGPEMFQGHFGAPPTQGPGVAGAARVPDPGSRMGALIAKLIAIPLLLVVAVLQQWQIYAGEAISATDPIVAPSLDDESRLVSSIMLKLREVNPQFATGGEPLSSVDTRWQGWEEAPSGERAREWLAASDARVTELRAAMVAGEIVGAEEAMERLEALASRLDGDARVMRELGVETQAVPETVDGDPEPDGGGGADDASDEGDGRSAGRARPRKDAAGADGEDDLTIARRRMAFRTRVLLADVELLRRHYRGVRALDETRAAEGDGRESQADAAAFEPALDGDAWTALEERHGWFARLARATPLDKDAPERAALLGGGEALLGVLLAIGGGLVLVGFGVLGAVIWAIVYGAMGRFRRWFVAPAVGGSAYVETAAGFILLFLAVQVLAGAVVAITPGLSGYEVEVSMACQWLVLPIIAWGLLRGASVQRWRRDLGLIAPRGVLREVGAGFLVYLAGLPVLVGAGLLGVVLKTVQDNLLGDHVPYTTGGNPILELVGSGDAWRLAMLFTLATVWAPIVEEVVFRGCLYRHIRSRVPAVVAALGSALAFGLMHGYELVLLGPVLSLGLIFAMMREWRGSLVGPIVMHALHNATVLASVILLVRLSA